MSLDEVAKAEHRINKNPYVHKVLVWGPMVKPYICSDVVVKGALAHRPQKVFFLSFSRHAKKPYVARSGAW